MKKFVLVPDSFKGSISSEEICDIMEKSLKKYFPDSKIVKIPVADGGEGSVDCFLSATEGEKVFIQANNAFFENESVAYGMIGKDTAVIEMASSVGLPQAKGRENPLITTTYGIGEQIIDAVKKGAKKVVLGLGGSSTTDGGAGMACALGYKFFNAKNEEFIPTGGTLDEIVRIEAPSSIPKVEFVAMCDVDNPLYGKNGAAYVYAPQKGADEAGVKRLDDNLRALEKIVKRDLKIVEHEERGDGAGGGFGFGARVFLGAKKQMGIDAALDVSNFDEIAKDADVVFTGEGRMDGQSLKGKVVIGVARRAKNATVIAVVGDIGDDIENAYFEGVDLIYSTNRVAKSFLEVKSRAKSDLALTMDTIAKSMKLFGN